MSGQGAVRLTLPEQAALVAAQKPWAPQGALNAAVEAIVEVRLARSRAAFVALLHTYHEADPDHCGGECFTDALIDHALTAAPVPPADETEPQAGAGDVGGGGL